MLSINRITIQYENEPIGLTEPPVFGWILQSDNQSVFQTAYRLVISKEEDGFSPIYDSGNVEAEDSAHITVENLPLESLTRYYVNVEVWDNYGEYASSKKTSNFVTGLLSHAWSADFISAEGKLDGQNAKSTYVRKGFSITKEVASAYACTTALGVYQFFLNGKKVGTDELTPGWTSYKKHLLYQVYDISSYLNCGTNVAGALLGAGWYKGILSFLNRWNFYGERTAFLGELHITYTDGTTDIIKTDTSWLGTDGPIVFADIYNGEMYDARKEIPGWCESNLDVTMWMPTEKLQFPREVLDSQPTCRVTNIEEIKAKRLFQTPEGDWVLDFGQNLSGWIRFHAEGKRGDEVELNCFEVLDAKGNVYTENLRKARQTVTYIFGEEREITFQPHFTFQGFQFARIKEFPGTPSLEDFTACVIHSNMEQTGFFECSNKELNQLQHNILWGLKDNFVDVPTDCPQRDERLGWTGDAQIFSRTACYLMNTYSFYKKWLKDLALDQTEEGGVPHVVPDLLTGCCADDWLLSQGTHSAAAWADAAVIIPWNMYQAFGDTQILIQQYNSMKNWILFMENHAKDYIWNYQLQFGDWVALDAEEGSYFGATPNDLTCTAFCAYSTMLFIKIAKILNHQEDVVYFEEFYRKIVEKYQETFFEHSGHMTVQTQTAHIVSLYFGLVPEEMKQIVVQDLLTLLEKEDGHLVTGFVGTPYFCHVLSENGHLKEAYDLLLKEDYPSWLYQVKMGATTVWEHWDGMKPDGTMWSPDMNSFNHYAYGAIGEWMYRVIAGIDTQEDAPGYKRIRIAPHIGGGLQFAKGTYYSVYGEIQSHWERKDNIVTLHIRVPVNTRATIRIEASSILCDAGIAFEKKQQFYFGEVGSGNYTITYQV